MKKAWDNNKKILIVEDSPTQAEQLKYILEKHGYEVVSAENGREAFARIKDEKPFLVISDIMMPEMDGYALCAKMRKDDTLKNIPLILLTSLSDPIDVIRGLECGANNFITKPYEEKSLLSRINYLKANLEIRKDSNAEMGINVYFLGKHFYITAERMQILDLLLSTYENAYQQNLELTKLKSQLTQLAEELEAKVEERTADLSNEIDKRMQKEEEIQRLNKELEQRVIKRTTQLEAANKELEAFSYSVSHDLRAPLRHMAGFTELLKKQTSLHLDEKSISYLNTIISAAKQMTDLIDDLLAFSRLGRSDMKKDTVDLSFLVKEVLNEFQPETRERDIAWKIDHLPNATGDNSLLKLVFVNLISNALKFTRNCKRAEIEIGTVSENNEMIFFIKDNGVGFDMQYSDKLFGVFQRLHRQEEFEGTGIGLANVRRIINRHGGRTWAEGKVGEGATFYFTLPRQQTEDYKATTIDYRPKD